MQGVSGSNPLGSILKFFNRLTFVLGVFLYWGQEAEPAQRGCWRQGRRGSCGQDLALWREASPDARIGPF